MTLYGRAYKLENLTYVRFSVNHNLKSINLLHCISNNNSLQTIKYLIFLFSSRKNITFLTFFQEKMSFFYICITFQLCGIFSYFSLNLEQRQTDRKADTVKWKILLFTYGKNAHFNLSYPQRGKIKFKKQ